MEISHHIFSADNTALSSALKSTIRIFIKKNMTRHDNDFTDGNFRRK